MIIVALPAYNEAEAIPRLLKRLHDCMPDLSEPLRVVVVDDGSRDGTPEAAAACSRDDMPVHVERHQKNGGLHAALDTCFRTSLRFASPTDWIVTMDADDTHPPDLIPVMMKRASETGASIVIASRFQPGAEWFGLSWDRLLFSYTVSWLFRLTWPMKGVRDYTCGYRAYRADLLQRAYARWGDQFVNEPSFACMPDVLWKVSRLSPVFAEVPLSLHYDRKPGVSKMNVLRTIRRTLALLVKRRLGIGG
ncbi:MAG: glycosyltransferase family 2 protein [Vicinamibacterales bacterium]